MSNTKSITKAPEKVNALAEIKNLNRFIDIESKKREILRKFISDHLKKGVDYGPIHVAGRNKCPEPWNCTQEKNPKHYSKDTLFKPGSEKFVSLFHLKPRFRKDVETWEMLGSKPGIVAYICELYNGKGAFEGEGRGVASQVEEKDSTPNKLVKMAEKRAQLDAVLRTGGLSDFFTQDLEDKSQRPPSEDYHAEHTQQNKTAPSSPRKASSKQISLIEELLAKKGQDRAKLLSFFKKPSFLELSADNASATIKRLLSMPDKAPGSAPKVEPSKAPAPIAPAKEEKKEEKTAKRPALNFQIAWIKGVLQQLLEMKIITEQESVQLDFITEDRFFEIQHLYKKQKGLT